MTQWLTKHADAATTIGVIFGVVVWMNGRFNEMDTRLGCLETRLVRIETVLIMKGIMPMEMATTHQENK